MSNPCWFLGGVMNGRQIVLPDTVGIHLSFPVLRNPPMEEWFQEDCPINEKMFYEDRYSVLRSSDGLVAYILDGLTFDGWLEQQDRHGPQRREPWEARQERTFTMPSKYEKRIDHTYAGLVLSVLEDSSLRPILNDWESCHDSEGRNREALLGAGAEEWVIIADNGKPNGIYRNLVYSVCENNRRNFVAWAIDGKKGNDNTIGKDAAVNVCRRVLGLVPVEDHR